jgi:hypothetical protein
MTSKNGNLNREEVLAATAEAYERLRNDPEAWAAYQAELKEWDAMPSPGLEDEPYRDEEVN